MENSALPVAVAVAPICFVGISVFSAFEGFLSSFVKNFDRKN